MGFLQRGFAYGNKRGFAVRAVVGAACTFTLKIAGVLLGGGGKIADQTTNILTFGKVMGLGSYPDALAYYLNVSLFAMGNQLALLLAALPPPPTVFTATVELSLGSYP